MENRMFVSSSPHYRSSNTTSRIMLDVIIALIPAVIASVIIFGARSLMIIGICIASCVLLEYFSRKIMKRDTTIGDLSAVVTGLLLAMNLPVSVNPLIAMFGCLVAIVVVKQMFGGIGMNFVNPALAARIVLMVSFPSQMMNWTAPFSYGVDAVTSPTPLASDPGAFSYMDLLLGRCGGCLGETCAVALLAGGVYLVIRKVIYAPIPIIFIGSSMIMSLITGLDPIYQALSGGLILGAVFMATDYTTTPMTKLGKIIFAACCGILTIIFRKYSNMAEGVSFSILLMNIFSPLLDNITRHKPYGYVKPKKGADK